MNVTRSWTVTKFGSLLRGSQSRDVLDLLTPRFLDRVRELTADLHPNDPIVVEISEIKAKASSDVGGMLAMVDLGDLDAESAETNIRRHLDDALELITEIIGQ